MFDLTKLCLCNVCSALDASGTGRKLMSEQLLDSILR
jgi:hypothetical protein